MLKQNSTTSDVQADNWGKLTSINHHLLGNSNLLEESYTIGRTSTNSISIPDQRLSGVHCRISKDPATGIAYIEDLSSNGTWLNEDKVGKNKKQELKNGDMIYLLHKSKVKELDILGYIFTFTNLSAVSSKRKAEEDLKRENELKEEKKQKMKQDDELGEEMQCSVCIDYIYQCITLIPCLHNFCSCCYSDWMAKSKECPQCREPVMEARKNANVNNIIDKFLTSHPDKKRSPEEYERMDKLNKITTNSIKIGNAAAPLPPPKEEKKQAPVIVAAHPLPVFFPMAAVAPPKIKKAPAKKAPPKKAPPKKPKKKDGNYDPDRKRWYYEEFGNYPDSDQFDEEDDDEDDDDDLLTESEDDVTLEDESFDIEEVKEDDKSSKSSGLERFYNDHPSMEPSEAEDNAEEEVKVGVKGGKKGKVEKKPKAEKKEKKEKEDGSKLVQSVQSGFIKCPECKAKRAGDGFQCAADQRHFSCTSCSKPYPDRGDNFRLRCLGCSLPFCGVYFKCTGTKQKGVMTELKSQGANVPKTFAANFLNGHKFESEVITNFMKQKNIKDMPALFQAILNDTIKKKPLQLRLGKGNVNIQEDSPICSKCFLKSVWAEMVRNYYSVIKNELPANIKNRKSCADGINCTKKDKKHAEAFEHMTT
jgi:hypothetical protein